MENVKYTLRKDGSVNPTLVQKKKRMLKKLPMVFTALSEEVEAVQVDDWNWKSIANWAKGSFVENSRAGFLSVKTSSGNTNAYRDDYILKDRQSNFFVLNQRTFEHLYEIKEN